MTEDFFEKIASGLAKHKLVPFFGAGTSAPQLQVLWKDLSDEMADAVGLPPDQRNDFLKVADQFVAAKGLDALAEMLRHRLIAEKFDDVKGWSHLFLLSLNAGLFYTTNQDNLFELASSKKGRPFRVVARLEDLAEWAPGEPLLIKYHGDLAYPDTVIFTGKSYNARIEDKHHFLNIRMESDLLSKGFLFLGYSFRDPNILQLFREIRAAFGTSLPPSYLIAYEYNSSMEDLHTEFGVNIINPCIAYPDAKSHDEAFKRYLKALSERVLHIQGEGEIASWLTPAISPAARIATEYDVAAVVSSATAGDFAEGLKTYRLLLDRTSIPDGLEADALGAFKQLCDNALTKNDLASLAAAIFNLSLSTESALEAISRLMVAINRIDHTDGLPDFMIISPAHGDQIIPVAAALAVVEIKQDHKKVTAAFRLHATAWMAAFGKLSPEMQTFVREQMDIAWLDGGSHVPDHIFKKRSGPFASKTFDDIRADLMNKLPQKLPSPPS